MMPTPAPCFDSSDIWALPPLILHPFADSTMPQKLVESSRAGLMIQGILPPKEQSMERLQEILLEGRFCEIRMLFYVGKDTARWIEQCLGLVDREPELRGSGIDWRSFATLLVDDPPAPLIEKLKSWGVSDHSAIFSRGLGLNSIFGDAPPREILSDDFVRNYQQFADQLFAWRMKDGTFRRLHSREFPFDLFASGEYTAKLEREWTGKDPLV